MLSDLLDVPGVVIPIWGADHYLKSGWDSCEMFERILLHLSTQNAIGAKAPHSRASTVEHA